MTSRLQLKAHAHFVSASVEVLAVDQGREGDLDTCKDAENRLTFVEKNPTIMRIILLDCNHFIQPKQSQVNLDKMPATCSSYMQEPKQTVTQV